MLTARQLIELLEQAIAESGEEDAPVQLALQPNWPLAHTIEGTYLQEGYTCSECEEPEGDCICEGEERAKRELVPMEPIIWLLEGGQLDEPYSVPEGAWEGARTA